MRSSHRQISIKLFVVGSTWCLATAPATGVYAQANAPQPTKQTAPALPAPVPPPLPPGSAANAPEAESPAPQIQYNDPYRAYAEGAYAQALQGFVDIQVERPDDPDLMLNIGDAHYRMNNWEEAEKAYTQAAVRGAPQVRAQAFYNLGNTAYKQGKLDEAIARYQAALEINPEDQDAKFNIEFVRDEIRRRHEEAQKRQQQQQNQGQQGEQQQNQDRQSEQQESQSQQGDQQPSQQAGPDSDQDGLPDAVETGGDNPTDPNNPDSDADGLPDGDEDKNRNGRVDEGESDPNKRDSDGDGVSDGAEAQEQQQGRQQQQGEAQQAQGGLTRDEAERYLQSLDDDRPKSNRRVRSGGRRQVEKDW